MALTSFHLTNTFQRSSGGMRTFYLNLLRTGDRKPRYRILLPRT